jgi:hypothetical protein
VAILKVVIALTIIPIFGISAWLLKYTADQLEAVIEMILELD